MSTVSPTTIQILFILKPIQSRQLMCSAVTSFLEHFTILYFAQRQYVWILKDMLQKWKHRFTVWMYAMFLHFRRPKILLDEDAKFQKRFHSTKHISNINMIMSPQSLYELLASEINHYNQCFMFCNIFKCFTASTFSKLLVIGFKNIWLCENT